MRCGNMHTSHPDDIPRVQCNLGMPPFVHVFRIESWIMKTCCPLTSSPRLLSPFLYWPVCYLEGGWSRDHRLPRQPHGRGGPVHGRWYVQGVRSQWSIHRRVRGNRQRTRLSEPSIMNKKIVGRVCSSLPKQAILSSQYGGTTPMLADLMFSDGFCECMLYGAVPGEKGRPCEFTRCTPLETRSAC